jgi:hypothetical protein
MKTIFTAEIEVESDNMLEPELVARILRTILNVSRHPLAACFRVIDVESQDEVGFSEDDFIDLETEGISGEVSL